MCLIALPILLLAALSALAAEPPSQTAYPLWDGQETVAEYAKRANLEPTKTLDLGDGVKLELVLIPVGKFMMGTPEPEPPWIGGAILGTAGLLALVLLAMLAIRVIRQRRWPQFSLRWLILLVALLGVVQYGGFCWWRTTEARKSFTRDESPAHEVTLSRPYYIGKYELTQEQYQQVMGTNRSNFKGRDLPMERVLWDEARAFCKKVSGNVGATVRLPSEAEWEYACRAGTRTRFCSGDADADLESVAWYEGNSKCTTHPMGGKASNAWGVHDMHGNVKEWCADWYEDYRAEVATDPQGPAYDRELRGFQIVGRTCHVLRGGSWSSSPSYCRSATREWGNLNCGYSGLGFLVVMAAPRTP